MNISILNLYYNFLYLIIYIFSLYFLQKINLIIYIYITVQQMKKKNKTPLGKSIMKSVIKKNVEVPHDDMAIFFQKSQTNQEYVKSQKLKSIIEQNSLAEFLTEAEMSNKQFEAERNVKMKDIRQELVNKKVKQVDVIKEQELHQIEVDKVLKKLRIPRRPHWTNTDTKAQYIKKQNESFLDWRKKLAQVQEKQQNIKLTPFEKNIQVWKQLWRVVQRAHILIQIVDARDPLFYRCEDLQLYVKQNNQSKKNILLINKSDLVSQQIRKIWNKYLIERKIDHIFFSAKLELTKIQTLSVINEETEAEEEKLHQTQEIPQEFNTYKIANANAVINCIKKLGIQIKAHHEQLQKKNEQKDKPQQKTVKKHFELEVGMVGYPNVGKSSVINTLLNKKKVAVASQPGKTKHYQTLYLTNQIVLCDCPGLVFPNVAATIAQMVLNGVVPIDTLREYYSPVSLWVKRIPRIIPEKKYGIRFSEGIYNAEKLLQHYAALKGFYTGRGLPNEAQAARFVLKDYTTGHIIYCKLPPDCKQQNIWQTNPIDTLNIEESTLNQKKEEKFLPNEQVKTKLQQQQLDGDFFEKQSEKQVGNDKIFRQLIMEQVLDLIQGKSVYGVKINKQLRKQLKFAIKRGETLDQIKKNYLISKKIVNFQHKQFIKV